MLAQILDHATRAVDRLASQFKNAGFLKGLISVFSGQVQEVETAFWGELRATRSVANATATTLDNIGALVSAPNRGTKNDAQYRNRVNTQIAANKSSGDDAVIYAVSKLTVSAWAVSGQPKITEHFPGSYVVQCTPINSVVNSDAEARELAKILADVSAGGVRGIVVSQQVPANQAFGFVGGPSSLGFENGRLVGAYDK